MYLGEDRGPGGGDITHPCRDSGNTSEKDAEICWEKIDAWRDTCIIVKEVSRRSQENGGDISL